MAQAQMRFTLSEELTALLDDLRGPATRTGYALWLLERGLRQEAAGAEAPPKARKPATRPSGSAPSAAELARERARDQRESDDPRSVIRNLPSMR
jgi:hypothetical protein